MGARAEMVSARDDRYLTRASALWSDTLPRADRAKRAVNEAFVGTESSLDRLWALKSLVPPNGARCSLRVVTELTHVSRLAPRPFYRPEGHDQAGLGR